jgi:hypothetical protein
MTLSRRHRVAAAFFSFSIAACSPPSIPHDDDDSTADAAGVEVELLNEPLHDSAASLFEEQPSLEHFTLLGWDSEDRWLDDFAGGFALLDCNSDGDADIFLTGAAGPNSLMLGDGTGHFMKKEDAGVSLLSGVSASASTADINNDGLPDILVMNQLSPNQMLVNLGDCVFEDRAIELGLEDSNRSVHATWIDLNADGWLDLYLTNYASEMAVTAEIPPPGAPDRLFLSDGKGGFTDVSDELPADTVDAYGMQTAFLDYDKDGDFDFFQTNDRGMIFIPNRAYRNDGFSPEGKLLLVDVTEEIGFTLRPDGMGLAIADIDNDGDPDILEIGNFEALFVFDSGLFFEAAAALGLPTPNPSTASWGGSFFDPDADGDMDILFVESRFFDDGLEALESYKGPVYFFVNRLNEGRGFEHQPLEGGLGSTDVWRSSAVADFNGDGFEDIIVNPVEGSPRIFLANPPEHAGVVQVQLAGRVSNLEGRGAQVSLQVGDLVTTRWFGATDPYSTGSSLPMSFALQEMESAGPLRIEWPSGRVQTIDVVQRQTRITVTEPQY